MARRKILVIEDNHDAREMLRMILENWGYQVHDAAEGKSGLMHFQEVWPDTLLVGYNMPGMNGVEVVRAARHMHPDLPVIFITAYSNLASLGVAGMQRTEVMQKLFNLTHLRTISSHYCRPVLDVIFWLSRS